LTEQQFEIASSVYYAENERVVIVHAVDDVARPA